MALRRSKRASEQDLYAHCRLGGDCIPDIKDKYEQNTWADKILKWVSGFLYLGTLGIGTGRGTGGSGGYIPLGGGGASTRGVGSTVLRPVGPVDPIGPSIPTVIDSTAGVETVLEARPFDPSVIEPTESGEAIELDTFNPDNDVVTETNPTDVPPSGAPTIDVTDTSLTEVRPTVQRAYRLTTTNFDNAAYNAAVAETAGEETQVSIIFDSAVGGTLVGGEDIELQEIPLTSTPETQTSSRPAVRSRKSWYHRYFRQFKAPSYSFLQPETGGTYTFENPAYEDLAGDFESFTARNLSEPQTAPAPGGGLRVGRLGQQSGMIMRSGTQTGQHIHVFADMSTIVETPAEADIELSSFITVRGGESPTGVQTTSFTRDPDWGVVDLEVVHEDEDYTFGNSRLRLLDVERADYEWGELESPKKHIGMTTVTTKDGGDIEIPLQVPAVPLDPGDTIVVSYTYESSIFNFFDPSLYRKRKIAFIS